MLFLDSTTFQQDSKRSPEPKERPSTISTTTRELYDATSVSQSSIPCKQQLLARGWNYANACCPAAHQNHDTIWEFKPSWTQDFLKGPMSEPESKKFRCKHDPVHPECKKCVYRHKPRDKYGRAKWGVSWVPCRKADAIDYMKNKHKHDYKDPFKSHNKSQDQIRSNKSINASARGPRHQSTVAPAPALHQDTHAQAAARHHKPNQQDYPRQDPQPRPTVRSNTSVPVDMAAPDTGFGQPFAAPQSGSMGPTMGSSYMPEPTMHAPPNYKMSADPEVNAAFRTPGHDAPQVPRGRPRNEYIGPTTEEPSEVPNPRKHRTRPAHYSSRGNPLPAPMREMALVMVGDRGIPSPPTSVSSRANSANSAHGGTLPLVPFPSIGGTLPLVPFPSMTASYHTRQPTPVFLPPFDETEAMPPPPAPTPPQRLPYWEIPRPLRR